MDVSRRRVAFGITEFCDRNGDLSRAFLYVLWKRGKGPRYMQVGKRRLITEEAEADWQRDMEREAATKALTLHPTSVRRPGWSAAW
jgi:hypothetical protein